jgi:hypothetical protein
MQESGEKLRLNYATPDVGPRRPSVLALIAAYLCLIPGVLLAAVGLSGFLSDVRQDFFTGCPLICAVFGFALCIVGIHLRSGRFK